MEKNREIKFEVLHNNKHFGYERINHFGQWEWCVTELNPDNMIRWTQGFMNNNNDLIRRQFTGLLDKNGKEIYEGDIVKDHYCEYSDDSFTVRFYNGAFYPMVQVKEGYNCILKYDKEQFEIIGNIYENPTNNI